MGVAGWPTPATVAAAITKLCVQVHSNVALSLVRIGAAGRQA